MWVPADPPDGRRCEDALGALVDDLWIRAHALVVDIAARRAPSEADDDDREEDFHTRNCNLGLR